MVYKLAAPGNAGAEAVAAGMSPSTSPPPWRKILYEPQPYPDNYVDKTFLASVLTNPRNSPPLEFVSLAKDSSAVARQVSTVAIYCVVYSMVYYGDISAALLITIETLLLLATWTIRRSALTALPTAALLKSDARQLALVAGWLLCLSPVLATLTRTFSEDTICALTIALFLVHLCLHDYEYVLNYTTRFRGSISVNAAVFASVLLAARLPSTPHVFAAMFLATQAFVLLPAQWRALSSTHQVGAAATLVLIAATMLLAVSKTIAASYMLAIATISGLCPWLMVRLQQGRTVITGPWDTAARAFLLSAQASDTGDGSAE